MEDMFRCVLHVGLPSQLLELPCLTQLLLLDPSIYQNDCRIHGRWLEFRRRRLKYSSTTAHHNQCYCISTSFILPINLTHRVDWSADVGIPRSIPISSDSIGLVVKILHTLGSACEYVSGNAGAPITTASGPIFPLNTPGVRDSPTFLMSLWILTKR